MERSVPASGLPAGSQSRSDDKMVGGPYWEGGSLRGDDHPLEYYENGYAKRPACLDRRKPRLRKAA
jgi:hypothetical protein